MIPFTQRAICYVFIILIGVISTPAYAFGILESYFLALEKDPTFRAAIKAKESGNENINIGRAELLPKLSINYHNSPYNWQTKTFPQSTADGHVSEVSRKQLYRSYSGSITLTQSIFDHEAYALYKAGAMQALMSDEQYRVKLLDLAVRVVNAYVEVAYAKDKIALAEAQKNAFQEQLVMNKRLMTAGEGSITDISETQARHSLAQVQVLEAHDELDAAQRELEAIIGVHLDQLDELQVLRTDKFLVAPMVPARFESWRTLALENNPVLAAARHGIVVAKYNVEQKRAGFMPRVQLYASHSQNDSGSDNTVNQKYDTNSIGLQISVPIYSGGSVLASTRQASADYGQAMYNLDAQTKAIINDLHKHYNRCIGITSRVGAYELAVKSAELQVTATRKSVLVGQRVNVDVLNAELQWYRAQIDLALAKYTYIKSRVALLNGAGTLNEKDIKQVADYFGHVSAESNNKECPMLNVTESITKEDYSRQQGCRQNAVSSSLKRAIPPSF